VGEKANSSGNESGQSNTASQLEARTHTEG